MKKKTDKLTETVKLAREKGLTYAEYQRLESLGQAKIRHGRLLIKGKDYY